MDYPELIAEVTERSGDSGVAIRAKLYLTLAEAALNKALRVAENETDTDLTTDADGEATLPTDYQATRMLMSGTWELVAGDWRDIKRRLLNNIVTPQTARGAYAIRGDKLVTTFADTDLTLYYYAALQPLDETGTNWLIETDPEIYLYAMLRQVFMAKLDAEKAMAAGTVLDSLIAAKRRSDMVARFGTKPFIAVGNVV